MATGRAVPAAFGREKGEFQYLSLQANTKRGGSEVYLSDQFFINKGHAFVAKTGELHSKIEAGPIVITEKGLIAVSAEKITGYEWTDQKRADRKGQEIAVRALVEKSSIPCGISGSPISAIGAGDHVVIGSENQVSLFSKTTSWQSEVEGKVYGLAAADGRLYVSTDKGMIYCFGSEKTSAPKILTQSPTNKTPTSDPALAALAKKILDQSKNHERIRIGIRLRRWPTAHRTCETIRPVLLRH